MRRIVIAALAVAFITAVVSQASAHGPQRSRRQSSRRGPSVSFNFGGGGYGNSNAFNAGRRFEQQRQFRQFQQFNDHCN